MSFDGCYLIFFIRVILLVCYLNIGLAFLCLHSIIDGFSAHAAAARPCNVRFSGLSLYRLVAITLVVDFGGGSLLLLLCVDVEQMGC